MWQLESRRQVRPLLRIARLPCSGPKIVQDSLLCGLDCGSEEASIVVRVAIVAASILFIDFN